MSLVTKDRVGPVGGLQAGHLVLAQGQVDRGDRIVEVAQLGRPDDRCGHGGLAKQPGKRDLRRGQAALAGDRAEDRKSTRLNSSHVKISYAVFCLKKKKTQRARVRLMKNI